MTLKARVKRLKEIVKRHSLPDEAFQSLSGLMVGAVADEAARCAKVAREESKRFCRDPDSIQYRVGHRIAELILIRDGEK